MRKTRILLVDDDPGHLCLIDRALSDDRPHVLVRRAASRSEFEEAIAGEKFDCVVMDFNLEHDCHADELLGVLKDSQPECPAIIVSGSPEQSIVVRCLRGGSVDFLTKDEAVKPGRLWGRVEIALGRRRRGEDKRRRSERRVQQLSALAETDPLTGLANRRALDRVVEQQCRSLIDRRGETSLVMIDLDHFKEINDAYGHAEGDKLLRAVGAALQHASTPGQTACRWGGEEFLLLAPNTSLVQAVQWAESMRKRIKTFDAVIPDCTLPVSASFGVFTARSDRLSVHAIEQVDEALYLAKRLGRDRVCTWEMVLFDRLAGQMRQGSGEHHLGTVHEMSAELLGPTQWDDLMQPGAVVSGRHGAAVTGVEL